MLTIYKASAGSGKTFTLVYEYVKVLLGVKDRRNARGEYSLNADRRRPDGTYISRRQPNRHRGILAITFTNAATKEMKTRVVKALARLVDPKALREKNDYMERLSTAFRCPEADVREAAGLALAELLYDYSNFHISTIDSFFQSVLRAFSREFDRQVDYDIELDTEGSLRDSVTDMLETVKNPSDSPDSAGRLRRWIERYATASRLQGKAYNFFNTDSSLMSGITRSLKNALDETYNRFAAELDEYLEEPDRISGFIAELAGRIDDVTGLLKDKASAFLKATDAFPGAEGIFKMYKRARQVMAGEEPDISAGFIANVDPADRSQKYLNSFTVQKARKAAGLSEADVNGAVLLSIDFCAALVHELPRLNFYRTLADSAEVLEFFGYARRSQQNFLRENNTMLIADTNRILKEIIDGAEAPFIYERLGAMLHTMLIDEFQDTSQLQWNNLLPLVRDSNSEGYDNLIIGDVKQSIYRFRNTDSRLLGYMVEDDPTLEPKERRGRAVEESTNRRSAWNVVRVNNAIFSALPALVDEAADTGEQARQAYEDVVQTPAAKLKDLSGFVDIRLRFSDRPSNRNRSVEDEKALMDKMIGDIRRQVGEGGYSYRDILVLVRTNNDGKKVVNYLKSAGVPVVSAESLLLNSSPAVRTVVSLMKMIVESYDRKSRNITPEEQTSSRAKITTLITRFNCNTADGMSPAAALRSALEGSGADDLDRAVDDIRAKNPANIVALTDAIIERMLNDEQRTTEYAYLAALQDLAVKHAESNDASLRKFIEDYDANVDKWTIKPAADEDAVEVMTIHKSKGLERACVHIPMCEWPLGSKDKSLWLETGALTGFTPRFVPPIMWFSKVSPSSPLCTYSHTGPDGATDDESPFAAVLAREFRLDVLDALNMTYVAFTRAARELIVMSEITPAPKSGDRSPAVSRLLKEVLECSSTDDPERCVDLAGNYVTDDENEAHLTIGEPTRKYMSADERTKADARAAGERDKTVRLGTYPVVLDNEGTRKLICIEDALSTDIGNEEEPSKPLYGIPDAALEGIHFHSIMGAVNTPGDVGKAVTDYCRRKDLDPQPFMAALEKAFGESAHAALIAGWFAPGAEVLVEQSIYDCKRKRIYRPDRVVVLPDGSATVVDYKFPTPGEDINSSLDGYKAQVSNYMRLLRLLGHQSVKGYIWYPREDKVVQV